ncbi:MAG: hypothetical protein JSV91_15280 [Phycisphaerales bacterium]|nr:MAG: hypothetical protein JSV91_15280 [Phycisphaerales bacterium]
MRVDHIAFQRATRVAGFGFLLQAAIGVALLVFGLISKDTAFIFGSAYVLAGLLPWVSLIVIFYQHAQERLEALEEDELATTREGVGSVFDAADEDIRLAARRLRLMHKWLMPAVSLLLAFVLSGLAWFMLRYMSRMTGGTVEAATEFHLTVHIGWAVAICLSFAAVSFIFSRFVAGMAKQPAWQNLRGGAAYMVGNALVMLAVAVGITFRFFENDQAIEIIARVLPWCMIVQAAEIVLNFILNLYRPRVPGEVPRPAFDSKGLSMLAAPDNLVRSLNEAVNYQFGFDVTSSWAYQLLLRSFIWLIALGVVVLVLLNTMVVVEPHEQAVKLAYGGLVGDKVYSSGVMWKWPWPFQTADVYDVSRVRELYLTAKRRPQFKRTPHGQVEVDLWGEKLDTDVEIEPFIVRSTRAAATLNLDGPRDGPDPAGGDANEATERVSSLFSILDAEIVLRYRIRAENDGLLDFLRFVPDTAMRRQRLTMRELALRDLALSVVTRQLATVTLDEVLSDQRTLLAASLRDQIQMVFDNHRTGVEVVSINVPMARPSGDSASAFEEVAMSRQARLQRIAEARRNVSNTFIQLVGEPDLVEPLLAEIDKYNAMRGDDSEEGRQATARQAALVEDLLFRGGGSAAQHIAEAEKDRWVRHMNTRAQASRLTGELRKFRASPDLYRVRETMRVYTYTLAFARKYVIGIDPPQLDLDVDLQELNPLFDFSQSLPADQEGGSAQ